MLRRTIDGPSARMLREIDEDVTGTRHMTAIDRLEAPLQKAMRDVPRHEFVADDLQNIAYVNAPLRIGHGQTISQPFIVALMTQALCPKPEQRILEIGTGCGYQTAVLARLVSKVYSVEIIPELASSAAERLARLGVRNVDLLCADGYRGWEAHAPYDGVIVTAAAESIPSPLLSQLKPTGHMVIPVGAANSTQRLVVIDKDSTGALSQRTILSVAFVPLTRRGASGDHEVP